MKKKHLLIIDDDKTFCDVMSEYLNSSALTTSSVHTGQDALDYCCRFKTDIILLDQKLPDRKGHTLCEELLQHNEQCKIIFTTAYPSFDNALNAIKAGAFDYISKPFSLDELDHIIGQATRTLSLEKTEQILQYQGQKETKGTLLIGKSPAFSEVKTLVELASTAKAPVLITGETGTGKSMIAKAIHYGGEKADANFISVNCAALPENLIEAELFGHEKGAFTGAHAAKKGVFELADGGTLFLDEIGEMDPRLQSKLLSVLDDKKIRRLGSEREKIVDVRIIAATNADLSNAVMNKLFREDLFFRLSVLRIQIPPLRSRQADIPELCSHLIKQLDTSRHRTLNDSELQKLMAYDWPGNIRELKNIIERAILLHQDGDLRPSELLNFTQASSLPTTPVPISDHLLPLAEIEKIHITHALKVLGNNQTQAAKALGISLSTLKRKTQKYLPT